MCLNYLSYALLQCFRLHVYSVLWAEYFYLFKVGQVTSVCIKTIAHDTLYRLYISAM